jgi:hypothetical protein
MGSLGPRVRRRPALALGLTVGVLAGVAAGAALLAPAASPPHGPSPQILHASPAVVAAGEDVTLSAATVCRTPGSDSCRVVDSVAHIRSAGAAEWAPVSGQAKGGGYRFVVPAALVPEQGFSYWLEFHTRDGASVAYPPAGERSPIRVITTAGLVHRALPSFSWDEVHRPDGVAARLPFGDDAGEAGRVEGGSEEISEGPSSFDVGPDGSIYVVDWLNDRVEVFSPRNTFERAIPLSGNRPMDLAVSREGRLYLSTLGLGATSYEVASTGRVLGRYPVAYGVAARVAATPEGPRVLVGPGQWAPVRTATGVPLSGPQQAAMQTESVPLADGSLGVSGEMGEGAFAAAWTRPDGSRVGAVVRLPEGVRAGTDYFIRPLSDGGAIVARGLWDESHFAVGVLRFNASAGIESFIHLSEPSIEQDARFSTVRFRAPDEVLVAYTTKRAFTIERFEVPR